MQLKLGRILQLAKAMEEIGVPKKEIEELPIYIGDDDELNGIHTAWYCQIIEDDEDDENFIEMIQQNSGNVAFDGKAILIS